LPDQIDYDESKHRLRIGKGHIDNVSPAVWAYEVSGKHVIRQWFSYRKRDRTRPIIGDRRPLSPLDKVQPESWISEYTTDLIDLLHVLGRLVAIEPRQAELLEKLCSHSTLDVERLRKEGALEMPSTKDGPSSGATNEDQGKLDLL